MSTEREHGTDAGYQQHRKANEQPCGNCLWARRLYSRKLRSEAKASREHLALPADTTQQGLHGSDAGLLFHARSNIAVCPPCLAFACNAEHDAITRYLNRRFGKAS